MPADEFAHTHHAFMMFSASMTKSLGVTHSHAEPTTGVSHSTLGVAALSWYSRLTINSFDACAHLAVAADSSPTLGAMALSGVAAIVVRSEVLCSQRARISGL